MKTFLAIVLCFCVGCGVSEVSVVSEQEKLAKRINDKMDLEEAEEHSEWAILKKNSELEIEKINLLLEFGKLTPDEKKQ